jgi:MATE family multidrug resistance protein
MIASGLSVAGSVEVGIAFGQKNYSLLEQKAKNTLLVVCIFMFFTAMLFIAGKTVLPGFFINDVSVVRVASILIVIAAFFQLSDGIQAVSLGLLRGIEDVKIPTYITLGVYWLFALPLSYVLGFVFGYNVYGVWMGLLAGLTCSALFLTLRFWSKLKVIKARQLLTSL